MTTTTVAPETRRTRSPFVADERLLRRRQVGPVDRLSIDDILALLPRLPDWPAATVRRTMSLRGATTILDWLLTHPGESWQDRWMVSGADHDTSWIDMLAPGDTRLAVTKRQEHVAGLACLLMCRVVLPSYDFLAAYRAKGLLERVRKIMRPEVFAHLENAAAERGLSGRDRSDALCVISKIVLHTGTDVDALTTDDVLEMFAWSVHAQPRRKQIPGLHVAWDLLGDIGVTPAELTLRSALRRGQRSTTELVDDYDIRCRPIRDVFIRYFDEPSPRAGLQLLDQSRWRAGGDFLGRHRATPTRYRHPPPAQRDRPGMEGTRAGRHDHRRHGAAAQEHPRPPDAGARLLSRHCAVGAGRPKLGAMGGAQPGA
jgi:hypothetical protein